MIDVTALRVVATLAGHTAAQRALLYILYFRPKDLLSSKYA